MLQDFRHAVRVLRQSPAVTAAALAALALGIGANTAIFSLMDAVVLRPLPYPHPERLMSVAATEKGRAMNTSWPMFHDWQTQSLTFESLAAYTGDTAVLTGSGDPLRLHIASVTPEMFHVLGISPLAGVLDARARTAIVSYGFWIRRFGGERGALGRSMVLDGEPYTLGGVLPAGFRFPRWSRMEEPDVYMPLAVNPDRRTHYLRAIGRLKPGVSLAQARAEMDTVAAAIERVNPRQNRGEGVRVSPLAEELSTGTRDTLTAFTAAVVFVLLIACANVSNLLLSQTVRRRREIAIRSALGASRLRVVRQFLAESLVLSMTGGLAGVLLAIWGMPLLVAAMPLHNAFTTRVAMGGLRLNWTVLGFAASLSLLAVLLFGLLPAWRASRRIDAPDRSASLLGSRGTSAGRTRGILIAAEVGLSLVLLTGAGLLVKSFLRLLSVDPGFQTSHLLTIDIELPENRYAGVEQRSAFVEAVLGRLGGLPGVRAASGINTLPLSKSSVWNGFTLSGSASETGDAGFHAIAPGYFEAMGIPLIRGRLPVRGDRGIGVIDQAMARRYWPNADPIGQIVETPRVVLERTPQGWTMQFYPERFQIVGIVGGVRHLTLQAEPRPEMYLLYSQMAPSDFTFVLRSSVDPVALARAAAAEIHAVDRDLPLAAVRTMDQLIGEDVSDLRFVLTLLMIFAAVAVALAAAGIFAVISHSVSQRAKEIGIRVALGADVPAVMRTVVGQTLLWVGAGVAAGAGGALAAGRLLRTYLFAVEPRDPAALAAAAALLAAIALFAAWIPARGAARLDPATTLRGE